MARTTLTLNTYEIVRRAVEEGTSYGYRRAHKHTDTPTDYQVTEAIVSGVMISLDEIIKWDENET